MINKKILIFGSCRLSRLAFDLMKNINFNEKIILDSQHNFLYRFDYKNYKIEIITQPTHYTTKLYDIYDNIKYIKKKIYQNIDPYVDKTFQEMFLNINININNKHKPRLISDEYSLLNDYNFHELRKKEKKFKIDMVIFEICSLKFNKIITKKYGDEYYGKNLPTKIDLKNQNFFDKSDLEIINLSEEEIFDILNKIDNMLDNIPIMIVGPNVMWLNNDYVNNYRKNIQNILKKYCNKKKNFYYFDMSNDIDVNKDKYKNSRKERNFIKWFRRSDRFIKEHYSKHGKIHMTKNILNFILRNL